MKKLTQITILISLLAFETYAQRTTVSHTAEIDGDIVGQTPSTVPLSTGITQQTVSTTATSSVCLDGNTSFTVTVDGSEVGLEYLLSDTLDGLVIDGPIAGTGNAIDFNTGNLSRTTTFEVLAQEPPTAGNALRFSGGQNDFASFRNAWNFDYSQGYTLEFVLNGNTDPQNFFNSLFSIGGDFVNGNTSIDDLEVYFQQSTRSLVVAHGRGLSNFQYNQYASPDNFTDVHIAIVFDPVQQNDEDKLRVYFDGVLQQQVNTDSQIVSMTRSQGAAWYLGDIRHTAFANLTDVCNGIFDEVRVWNYGRSASEVNANRSSCVSPSEQGLMHYYRFDEGTGFVLTDETGNGHDMDILSGTGNIFWVPELISCGADIQVSMANTVTIGDLDAPTLMVVQNLNLDLGDSGSADLDLASAILNASDNCSDSSALEFTADKTQFNCADLGINTVVVTAKDEAGNETSSSVSINVRDLIAPQIIGNGSGLPPLEFALDENKNVVTLTIKDLRSTVQDNCDDDPTVSLSKTTFSCTELGMQTITISATDASGNLSTATEDVLIIDRTLPTFTVLNPVAELDENGSYTVQQADIVTNLADNCSDIGEIAVTFDNTPFTCSDLGTFDFNFTISDGNGNTADATSSITVVDLIDPVVLTRDITLELDQNGTLTIDPIQVDGGSTDNCSFTLSLDKSTFTSADLGDNLVTLTATDVGGNTASASAMVTVENPKTPQAITFPQPDNVVYGDGPITLSASSSSGLEVSYTILSGPGNIINGNELELVGAGDIVIEATQLGDDSFGPADPVVVAIQVAKAVLTVTALDVTVTFGSNDLLTFSLEYTGFVNEDDALSIDQQPTASTTASSLSDAGTYAIMVTGGSDDNYEFNRVAGTFTVQKADQIISFPAIEDTDLASSTSVFLSASSDANLPIQYTILVGTGIASFSSSNGTELLLNGTGTVMIEASQTGTTNYNPAQAVSQTFEVIDSRKQDQAITFEVLADVTYGDGPITLSATASSGLTVSFQIIGPASLSGTDLTIDGVGTVEVIASQAGDDSFNAAVDMVRSFVVSPASITIIPDDFEMFVGDQALPAFTLSYSGFVNGEDASVFSVQPVADAPTADLTLEGTYPIVITQDAVAANYVFTNEEGTLTVMAPLSANDESLLIFYPNPVGKVLNVKGLSGGASYSLLSINGAFIRSGPVADGVDFIDLEEGNYIVMVHDLSGKLLKKEIIIKR